jgi:hypothetical protein
LNAGSGAPRGGFFGAAASLCEDCAHVRVIRSERGSHFYMCRRAAQDARYPKYPGQPVRSCAGYERAAPDSAQRAQDEERD